ncbi:MAG: DUF465 domain-containing protein [Kordiimonadaceae bacterium]|jgi:hypothetical protein|nr:DUF465 domain-containing protein [Kordiimonadaceae bacterium]MDB4044163.1 DUF465 domain-containing protein [Emcibacteraceae bacterium]MBT6135539.1 DUF465 domain-containing protein [Kordiimonadaceae bacterium]MBT6467220.1 DUF465 domain-containing protein [Kordiimonadaceae bacterium]MBT7545556.1 DUF465 domain-containing protein [Kordiimonadaceae bacterium]|tara:strand:+ start:845 stop:1048 length:204 start_codon:yes stop_codon:yes gene_type:complete
MNLAEDDNLIKIQQLRVQHRDLDDAIAALIATGTTNLLQVKRLKKQKLFLRDMIAKLEDKRLPDIIA